MKYDDCTLTVIYRIAHSFFQNHEYPMVEKIRSVVNTEKDLPNFSTSGTRRLIHDMEFVFKKRKCESILINKEDIALWRHRYFRKIKQYRQEKRNVRSFHLIYKIIYMKLG